ncbi:hypothetical protein GCM10022254_60190 [Actinomadura meridiana]|uniref:Uncharacterized protein n=1 Tax=Actinomadura meridiana TaxID=559626 RepID=A0ABP8CIS0_9ACTN
MTFVTVMMALTWFGAIEGVSYENIWWETLAKTAITPIALWGPILLALTAAYYTRRSAEPNKGRPLNAGHNAPDRSSFAQPRHTTPPNTRPGYRIAPRITRPTSESSEGGHLRFSGRVENESPRRRSQTTDRRRRSFPG